MPEDIREIPAPKQRFTCPALGGNVDFEGCQQVTAVLERNENFCSRFECPCPWRACRECLKEGRESQAVDPHTGLCLRHGGIARVEPMQKIEDTPPPVLAHPNIEPSFWKEIVARYHESKKNDGENEPTLLELSDAISAMRAEGKSHAEINAAFDFPTHNAWSPRLYALRCITHEAREALAKLTEMPSLNVLTSLAYSPQERQVAYLQSLLDERERMINRQRKELAEKTVRFLTKLSKASQELRRRVNRSGKDIQNSEDFLRTLEETMTDLQECRRIMTSPKN